MSEVQIAIIDQEDTQITLAVPGVQGPVGNAIPSGGTTNQVLFKSSATNYDATWGNVTSAMITDLAIVNADVNASAAIAGSKISPDFGAQTIVTTGVHSAALGAAATPSITFTGDLNTGIYSPSADQLAVATNGTQRLTVDTAATTSTLPVVHPLGAVGTPSITFTGDLNTGIYSPTADTLAFVEGGSEVMRITDAGLVGIGSNSPQQALHVSQSGGNNFAGIRSQNSNSGTGLAGIEFSSDPTYAKSAIGLVRGDANGVGSLVFYNASSTGAANWSTADERMRITSAGNVGIAISSPQTGLHIANAPSGASTGNVYVSNIGQARYKLYNGGAVCEWLFGQKTSSDHAFTFSKLASSTESDYLTITSAGNVGIATSSPQQALHVSQSGGNNFAGIRSQNSNTGTGTAGIEFSSDVTYAKAAISLVRGDANGVGSLVFYNASSTGAANWSTSDERLRIDSSGRLLIGTSSDTGNHTLTLQGNSAGDNQPAVLSLRRNRALVSDDIIGLLEFSDNGNYVGANIQAVANSTWNQGVTHPSRLVFSTTADGGSSPTERMRINNGGLIQTFATANDAIIGATGSAAGTTLTVFSLNNAATSTQNGTTCFRIFTNGNAQNTNNSYLGISDIKLKENIADANSQWNDLKALQVRKYNFKEETGHQTHTQIGLVAQEVELVSPGLVNESPDRDEDGNDLGTVTKSVNYSVLYMKAVKALQEAMERIEQLEASNTDLLARVIALEAN